MNKYERGKIYQIIAPDGTIYIGSTISTLVCRFGNHRRAYTSWKKGRERLTTVFEMFEAHGVENCKIELIESYPCVSKRELERREGEIIKQRDCINKVVAGRTSEEYRIDNKDELKEKFKTFYEENREEQIERVKQYYIEHSDQVKARAKKYVQEHPEETRERKRLYRLNNPEKIREQKRKWNELNRDKINARRRELRAMKKS